MQRAIAELERRALASGRAFEPITVDVNSAGTVANITVPIAGNGTDAASNASFRMLRNEVVPETVGALPDTQAGVTGQTAEWRDQADALKSNLPPVVAFVLLFAFGLMLVAFRSIVVAIKAILLNLLSVAAAYGVLVLVFQHGVGKGLLGVSSAAGIDAVVPLLLFVILFGLSMDYHVFILSRIRETFDRGKSMDEAVSHGIKSTAGVVTSAAIVMVCRLRDLRDALVALLQAVRRRARRGDPDRRDDRPGGAPARVDEAARRLELVPAQLAPVAASSRCLRRRGISARPTRQHPSRRRRTVRNPRATAWGFWRGCASFALLRLARRIAFAASGHSAHEIAGSERCMKRIHGLERSPCRALNRSVGDAVDHAPVRNGNRLAPRRHASSRASPARRNIRPTASRAMQCRRAA